MSVINRAQAVALAEIIRDETATAANTATRVGGLFVDYADSLVFGNDGAAVGQVLRWTGTAWAAGALDLDDSDAITGKLPFANLADGSTAGEVLTWNGSAWASGPVDLSDGDAITNTLDASRIGGGSQGQVLGWNAGNASFTGNLITNSIGTTTGVALKLSNTTDAANGAQQYSPALGLAGETWTGSASQVTEWAIQSRGVQGNPPNPELSFSSQVNGGGWSTRLLLNSRTLVWTRDNSETDVSSATASHLDLVNPGGTNTIFRLSAGGTIQGGLRAGGGLMNWHSNGGYQQFYTSLTISNPALNITPTGIVINAVTAGLAASKAQLEIYSANAARPAIYARPFAGQTAPIINITDTSDVSLFTFSANSATLAWGLAVSSPTLTQTARTSGTGQALSLIAQSTSDSGATGGKLTIQSGSGTGVGGFTGNVELLAGGTGTKGKLVTDFPAFNFSTTSDFSIEANGTAVLGFDVNGTTRNISIFANGGQDFQSGNLVVFWNDATAVPTAAPSAGVFGWSQSGRLVVWGTGNTRSDVADNGFGSRAKAAINRCGNVDTASTSEASVLEVDVADYFGTQTQIHGQVMVGLTKDTTSSGVGAFSIISFKAVFDSGDSDVNVDYTSPYGNLGSLTPTVDVSGTTLRVRITPVDTDATKWSARMLAVAHEQSVTVSGA